MNTLRSISRAALVWLAPFTFFAILLAWQTDWGRAFAREPSADAPPAPAPLSIALLPEYQPQATPDKNKDAVERTLFNPTRRPAPQVAAMAGAAPKLQRGQFALSGTIVVEGKTTAFLKETNGGKPRRVTQGEVINGMTVASIAPDRVKLSLGDETEELVLKVAAGPKTTIQPVVPNAPVTAGAPPRPGVPGTAPAAVPGQPTTANSPVRDVADVLAERRRAARAAEAAAAGLPPGTPVPTPPGMAVTAPNMPPVPQGNPNSGDPRWQGVYQRYQQPRR
jgi:hypothetical protein